MVNPTKKTITKNKEKIMLEHYVTKIEGQVKKWFSYKKKRVPSKISMPKKREAKHYK